MVVDVAVLVVVGVAGLLSVAVAAFVISVYVRLAALVQSPPVRGQYLRLAVFVQHRLSVSQVIRCLQRAR